MKKLILCLILLGVNLSLFAQKDYELTQPTDSTYKLLETTVEEENNGLSYNEVLRQAYFKAYRAKARYASRLIELSRLEKEENRLTNIINSASSLDTNYFDINVERFTEFLGDWKLIVRGQDRIVEKVELTLNNSNRFRIRTRTGIDSAIDTTGRFASLFNMHTVDWVEIKNLYGEEVQLYEKRLYGSEERSEANVDAEDEEDEEDEETQSRLPFFIGNLSDGRRVILRQTKIFIPEDEEGQ